MVTELREGVYWIDLRGVNAYLLAADSELTLIDAGTPFAAGAIEAGIEAAGFALSELDRILITHYDVDHVGTLGKLGVDAPIYVGDRDVPFLTGARKPALSSRKPLVQRLSGPLIPAVDSGRIHPVADGEEIAGFTAFHTPGHTPGHTVYVHADRAAAFLGDLVIEWRGEFRPSPWLLSYDTDAVAESIRSFVGAAPPFEVGAVGHGTPVATDGSARLERLAASV